MYVPISVEGILRPVPLFHRLHSSDYYDYVGIFAGFRWEKLHSCWKDARGSFSSDSVNITGYHSQILAVKSRGAQGMNVLWMQSKKTSLIMQLIVCWENRIGTSA